MWFKGADTHSVAKWVEHKFGGLHARAWDGYRLSIYHTAKCANAFLSQLYRGGLWLQPSYVAPIIKSGMTFLREYRVCAQYAFDGGKCRFKISPKFHAFCHIVHSLIEQVGNLPPRVMRDDSHSIINPLTYSCQLDEDFVGQISSLSRTGTLFTAHQRVMDLYLLNLPKHW